MTAWAWSARAGDQTERGIVGRIRRHRARRAQRRDAAIGPNLRRRLVIIEGVAIAMAWAVALTVGDLTGRRAASGWTIAAQTIVLTGVGLGLSWVLGLYRSRVSALRSATFERQAAVAVLLSAAAWVLGKMSTSAPAVSPVVFGGLLTLATLMVIRSGFDAWVTLLRRRGEVSRPVVLVGSTQGVHELGQLLTSHPEIGYRSVGHLDDAASWSPEVGPWLGPRPATAVAALRMGATGALIAANGIASDELNEIVRELHTAGLHVHMSSGLTRIGHQRVRPLPVAHEPFFYLEPAPTLHGAALAKRLIDIVGATVMLVVTAPISVASAIAIKACDRGPVLFHQVRVGHNGKPIVIHKFRTMSGDAESKLEDLKAANVRSGPFFKVPDDPRVTSVGRWLRASSIDELPQLLNVLRGELSLVGPRPSLLEETARFDQGFLARLDMRPGITGLWQVEARHNPSFQANRHLDLFYVENWRLGLDLAILLATLHTVVIDSLTSAQRARQRRRDESPALPVGPGRDESPDRPQDLTPADAAVDRQAVEVGA